MDNKELRKRILEILESKDKSYKWLTLELFPTSIFDRKYSLLRKMLSRKGDMDLYPIAKEVLIVWLNKEETKNENL
jgi:hypothetical protein